MKLLWPQFSEILLFLYLIASKNSNLQEQGKYNQKRLLQEGHMRHKHRSANQILLLDRKHLFYQKYIPPDGKIQELSFS